MNEQPEALRLAEIIDPPQILEGLYVPLKDAATELRRLHEANQELIEALDDIAGWTERYTKPGHPISTVARRALAKARGTE